MISPTLKKLLTALSFVAIAAGLIYWNETRRIDLARSNLSASGSLAEKAFNFLMWESLLSSKSRRVLSDAYAHDSIAFESWLGWIHDLRMTNKSGHERYREFEDYVFFRCSTEPEYASSLARQFGSWKMHRDSYFELMEDPRLGARIVGHLALRNETRNLPDFDPKANAEMRSEQLASVRHSLGVGSRPQTK